MKTFLSFIILILLFTSGTLSATATTVCPEGEIPIIAWHGIPAERSAEIFPLMKEAGINIYLGKYSDLNTTLDMLDIARDAGVKLIPQCPELKSDVQKTVKQLMNHPALYGYYLKDEPETWDLPELGEWVKQIQAVDNHHPCYINLYPNWAWIIEKYAENLDAYIRQVPVPFISFDQYPIVEVRNAPSILRPGWYRNLEEIRAAAQKADLPIWAFAMAWSHDLDSIHHYPVPTLPELRLQQFSNLAYGAQALQYFTFRGAVNDSGKTPVFEHLKILNAEIQNLAGVFLGSKVISVQHTGIAPEGTRPLDVLPPPIRSLETSGGAVVSLLENGDNQYLVIVNRDYRNPIDLKISTDKYVQRVLKDGSVAPVESTSIQVEAGDMVIYMW